MLHKRKRKKEEEALLWRRITRRRIAGVYIYIYIFSLFCWATGRPVAYRRGYNQHTRQHIILYTSHIRSSSSSSNSLGPTNNNFYTRSALSVCVVLYSYTHAGQQYEGRRGGECWASQRRGALGSQQDASTSFSSSSSSSSSSSFKTNFSLSFLYIISISPLTLSFSLSLMLCVPFYL